MGEYAAGFKKRGGHTQAEDPAGYVIAYVCPWFTKRASVMAQAWQDGCRFGFCPRIAISIRHSSVIGEIATSACDWLWMLWIPL